MENSFPVVLEWEIQHQGDVEKSYGSSWHGEDSHVDNYETMILDLSSSQSTIHLISSHRFLQP